MSGLKLVAYCRVSDESENIENQKYAIFEWVAKNGHTILEVFEDIGISGMLPPLERPGFRKMYEYLDKCSECDGVVVYSLDRIARSLTELFEIFKLIVEKRGKVIISVLQYWLELLDPTVRKLVIAVLGIAAELESKFASMRTKESLRRAKAEGKHIGRPRKVNENVIKEALKYIEKGYSLKDTAKLLGVAPSTLCKYLTRDYRETYYSIKARVRK